YLPREHFKVTDDDHSSVRIRDMPYGKHREALDLTPGDLNYNSMILNRISPPKVFLLSNVGYDQVTVLNIQVVGDFVYNGPPVTVVDIGETISLYVSFLPIAVGTVTGGLYVTAPGAVGTKFATLTGLGVVSEDLLMQ